MGDVPSFAASVAAAACSTVAGGGFGAGSDGRASSTSAVNPEVARHARMISATGSEARRARSCIAAHSWRRHFAFELTLAKRPWSGVSSRRVTASGRSSSSQFAACARVAYSM